MRLRWEVNFVVMLKGWKVEMLGGNLLMIKNLNVEIWSFLAVKFQVMISYSGILNRLIS